MLLLKKLRIERKVSQAELARKLKTDQGRICNIENGKLYPWKALRQKLSRFFGLPIEELLKEGGDDNA